MSEIIVNKPIIFVAGLPRSGSTLFMNILGQNPNFHVTPTSGILSSLVQIRNSWDQNDAFKSQPKDLSEKIKVNVLRSMLNGYMAHSDKPVFIDKNRLWLEHIELISALIGRENIRILVTVRDLRDVIASFEMRSRETSMTSQSPLERVDAVAAKTALGRVKLYIDNMQPIGRAYNAIRDAMTRGWGDKIFFIEYDALTGNPKATMSALYPFIQQENFQHDFDHVEQVTFEDDSAYGLAGLHTIRNKVEPQESRWPSVFDEFVTQDKVWMDIEKLAYFWRNYLQ
ncbi:MAG: sulfotransferase [Gammaproteobacteria bacterium]|nr:sulfotransferase [Gammaproteobacteria bacterium]